MLIGIDGNEANISNRVGVGQYAFNLIWSLYKTDQQNSYVVYLKKPPLKDLPPATPTWSYKYFGPGFLWTKLALPFCLFLQRRKPNLFFSPSHYSPSHCPCPTIPTIHDLGYLKNKKQFTRKDRYQLVNWTKQSIKQSTHIITVSEFSKNEIASEFKIDPNKISIAYNGVSPKKYQSDSYIKEVMDKFHISTPYFLCLGTLKPNKNIPFLLKSFADFLVTYPESPVKHLVIAGKKGWLFDDIFNTVKSLHLENFITFTDYISEDEKWAIYRKAYCLILPSTYEGFGIPAIEAMSMEVPVIVSKIPSLIEVVNNAGLYINPESIEDLIDKMHSISDPYTHEIYKQKGLEQSKYFTWENTGKSVLNAFEKLKLSQ